MEESKPNGHITPDLALNDDEKQLLTNCNMAAINAKARIYDLQVELETARQNLRDALNTFQGALAGCARARDINEDVGVKQDFSGLIRMGVNAQ